jgi:hypothetical protein
MAFFLHYDRKTLFEIFVFEELEDLFVEGFLGAKEIFFIILLRWFGSIRRRIVFRNATGLCRLMNHLVVRCWLHALVTSLGLKPCQVE